MISFRRLLATVSLLICSVSTSLAWTVDGHKTGGGMSATSCSYFLEAMATARQFGFDSDKGVSATFPWLQHITGFISGYNLADPGTFDLVAVARADGGMTEVNLTTLNVADLYCRDNPTAPFYGALKAIVVEFHPSSDRRATE